MHRVKFTCGCKKVVKDPSKARCHDHPEGFVYRRENMGGGRVEVWDGESWQTSGRKVYAAIDTTISWSEFIFEGGNSHKFWNILTYDPVGSGVGCSYLVHFGRVGTAGQHRWKTFADRSSMLDAATKIMRKKMNSGYVRVGQFADVPIYDPETASSAAAQPPSQQVTAADFAEIARTFGFSGTEQQLKTMSEAAEAANSSLELFVQSLAQAADVQDSIQSAVLDSLHPVPESQRPPERVSRWTRTTDALLGVDDVWLPEGGSRTGGERGLHRPRGICRNPSAALLGGGFWPDRAVGSEWGVGRPGRNRQAPEGPGRFTQQDRRRSRPMC